MMYMGLWALKGFPFLSTRSKCPVASSGSQIETTKQHWGQTDLFPNTHPVVGPTSSDHGSQLSMATYGVTLVQFSALSG